MKNDERIFEKEDRGSSGSDGRVDYRLAQRTQYGEIASSVSADVLARVPSVRREPPDLGSEYSGQESQGPFQVGDLIFDRPRKRWAVIMRVIAWDDRFFPGGYFGTLYFANPDYTIVFPAFLRDPRLIKDKSVDGAGYIPLKFENF